MEKVDGAVAQVLLYDDVSYRRQTYPQASSIQNWVQGSFCPSTHPSRQAPLPGSLSLRRNLVFASWVELVIKKQAGHFYGQVDIGTVPLHGVFLSLVKHDFVQVRLLNIGISITWEAVLSL